MNDQKQIIDQIAEHLAVTPQDIDPQASLKDDLGLGPIEIADLLTDLANKFSVTFNPADTGEIETINDLIVMIEDLMLE